MAPSEENTGSQQQSRSERSPNESGSSGSDLSQIDLQTLAERVLKLMKDEARLERERQGRRQP